MYGAHANAWRDTYTLSLSLSLSLSLTHTHREREREGGEEGVGGGMTGGES
jgi:hypothetical protein